ncbi:hypothetical protein Tco_1469230, partial [Tanacetum coccineum]
ILLIMSGSEPGEMASESLRAVVMPKFDMHIYTSTLTTKELKDAIAEYCIPMDLHARLPPLDFTMDKLSPRCFINCVLPIRTTPPLGSQQVDPEKSPAQRNLEKLNPKIATAKEKKDQQNLAKAQAKHAEREVWCSSKKRVHVIGKFVVETQVADIEETVNLRGNTYVPTPIIIIIQPLAHAEHGDVKDNMIFSEGEFLSFVSCMKIPMRILLTISFYRTGDFMMTSAFARFGHAKRVSHLATPAEEEFLGGFLNVEVVSRAYQSLGQCVLLQGELLRRHE